MQIGGLNPKNIQATTLKAKAPAKTEIKDIISLGSSEKTIDMPADLTKLATLKSGVADSDLFKKIDLLTGVLVGVSAAAVGIFGGAPTIGTVLSSAGGAVFGGLLLKSCPQTALSGLAGAYIGAGIGTISGPTGVLIGGGIGAVAGGIIGSWIMDKKMDKEHQFNSYY